MRPRPFLSFCGIEPIWNWRLAVLCSYCVLRPGAIGYYVGLTIIGVLTALITIYHKQIVHWLTPAANWMHQ